MLEHNEQIGQITHRVARHKEITGGGFRGDGHRTHRAIQPLATFLNRPRLAIGDVKATIGPYLVNPLVFAGELYKGVVTIKHRDIITQVSPGINREFYQ